MPVPPIFERSPILDKSCHNPFSVCDPLDIDGFGMSKHHNKLRCESIQSDEGEEKSSVFNMADFYDSIPDYNDINHLSESDFYGHLEGLKRKQAILKSTFFDNDAREEPNTNTSLQLAGECELPTTKISFSDKKNASNPCATRLGFCGKKPRSKSAGSIRANTVVSPFKMTKREEDENMLREIMIYRRDRCVSADPARCSTKKKSHCKGLNVPYTSKYPMYDQIVADQMKRSELVKLNSKLELQSKMKPFHFYTNKSNKLDDADSLLAFQPLSPRKFRAKPCPRNILSNYFHHKMWEDEQFRAMNRKIRAEELLRASSLPASMRKRQSSKCAITIESATSEVSPSEASSQKRSLNTKRRAKRVKRKMPGNSRQPTPGSGSFITTSPSPFEFETAKRCSSRKSDKHSDIASSETVTEKCLSKRTTPKPIYPAARPNLAANLREEWSRKKLCEMSCAPKDTRDTVVRPNWGVRKTPAWRSLYYDYTNDEDISMRLSTRRAEERLRQEEHFINMELMRQRVRATPLLLEGDTSLPNTLTAGAHRCYPPPQRRSSCSNRTGSRVQSAQLHPGRGQSRNTSALSCYTIDSQCGGSNSLKGKLARKIRRSMERDGFGTS